MKTKTARSAAKCFINIVADGFRGCRLERLFARDGKISRWAGSKEERKYTSVESHE